MFVCDKSSVNVQKRYPELGCCPSISLQSASARWTMHEARRNWSVIRARRGIRLLISHVARMVRQLLCG